MSQTGARSTAFQEGIVAANILIGFINTTASGGPTTVITIPAGRTWVGSVTVQCVCYNAAAVTSAAVATGVVTTAGTGVVPAAASYLRCDAVVGADAVGGLDGDQSEAFNTAEMYVVAPAGNSVTVAITSTVTGTGRVNCTASGLLQ